MMRDWHFHEVCQGLEPLRGRFQRSLTNFMKMQKRSPWKLRTGSGPKWYEKGLRPDIDLYAAHFMQYFNNTTGP